MSTERVRLFADGRGSEMIYDGPTGLDFTDFLSQRGPTWGIVNQGSMRLTGTFRVFYGRFEGRWWEFEQDNDFELLDRMTVWPSPFARTGINP